MDVRTTTTIRRSVETSHEVAITAEEVAAALTVMARNKAEAPAGAAATLERGADGGAVVTITTTMVMDEPAAAPAPAADTAPAKPAAAAPIV